MSVQIRPTRLEVTDRFPMLAFSLDSQDGPRLAEVVLAADLALFTDPAARNLSNFYSSREHGMLAIPAGGAVYTVPPQVLARFIAADRLWFGLATATAPGGQDWRIDVLPGEASPYVSLKGLTDRALRRVRMYPVSPRRGIEPPAGPVSWAGDTLQTPPATAAAPAATAPAAPPVPAPYDDGFGPLEPLAPAPVAAEPATPPAESPVVAQGLAGNDGIDPEARGIDCGMAPWLPGDPEPATAVASALALTAADYPRTARIAPSPAFTAGRSGRSVERIVIHITDGPSTASAVNTFTAANAQASSHYLVGQDGEVVQFVSEADTAWHARGGNSNSIGIEHVAIKVGGADYPRRDGTMQHFDALAPTAIQYSESAALVTSLCDKYGIVPSRTTIIGHNEVATNHPQCPTGNWDWDHFMYLVTNRVSAPLPTAQGMAARGLDAGTQTVEIKYRAFIPSPLIKGPNSDYDLPGSIASGEDFSGDNRSFSYDQGTSRADITALVDVAPDGALSNHRIVSRSWGESKAYDSTYTYHVDGKPDWWMDRHAGLDPIRRGTLAATPDNLSSGIGFGFAGISSITRQAVANSERASAVTVTVEGALPLVSPSPDIDASVSVLIRPCATGLEVRALGGHDGFPAHELYVNGTAIHTYDPVAAGKSPTSLFGSSDIDVDTSWVPLPQKVSAVAHALAGDDFSRPGEDGEISGPVHELEPAATATALALTAADYPGAIVMPSPAFNAGRAGQTIDRIVVHITSSRQSPHLGTWFTRPNANSSAHYMVDQLGAVRQFVAESDTSWHAGNRAMNRRSIGIEHVAVEQGGARYGSTTLPYTPPSDIEYETSAALVAHLCRKYSLTPDRTTIIGHAEANPSTTHTSCPTGAWDWDRYMGLVSTAYAVQTVGSAVGGVVDAVRGAVGLSADDWSINWDEVYPVGQPTGVSCWATAAAMIEGWRLRQSVAVDSLANFDKFTVNDGLPNASHARFAESIGFTVHPNACYTAEGFRDIIEANGPVWVVAKVPGQHAIVVTGMYRKDGQIFVRITDPWDRVVGSPGSPGSYATTHVTGSQYIMTYDAFTAEFEAAAADPDFPQLLHTGGTHGHTINRGTASGAGYAQSLARQLGDESPAAVTPAPAQVPDAQPVQTRRSETAEGRSYDLAQLAGMQRPGNALAGGAGLTPIPAAQVVLSDWPYIDEPEGRSAAPVAIDWKFDGAAVGEIAIAPAGGAVFNGRMIAVKADIAPGGGTANRAEVLVIVTTTFTKPGETDEVAVSEVCLNGDGLPNVRHLGTKPANSPPQVTAPAMPELAPA